MRLWSIAKKRTRFTRLYLSLAFSFAFLFFASGFCFWGPRDLVYRWQPYSVWLRDLSGDALPPGPKDPQTGLELRTWEQNDLRWRAATLLREAGTNAMPAVLSALAYRDSTAKLKLEALLQKVPRLHISFTKECTYHLRAIRACQVLGPDAASAVPLLAPFLARPDPYSCDAVMVALTSVGPAAVGVLRASLTNSNEHIRFGALHSLGLVGPKARSAVPDLIELTTDPDLFLRWEAIRVLGLIKVDGSLVLPALNHSLYDQHLVVRAAGAEALGPWGS